MTSKPSAPGGERGITVDDYLALMMLPEQMNVGTLNRVVRDLRERLYQSALLRQDRDALLREAYMLVVKPVADAYVSHGGTYWSLRDRISKVLEGA